MIVANVRTHTTLLAILATALTVGAVGAPDEAQLAVDGGVQITIQSPRCVRIQSLQVEVAADDRTRARGLMHRTKLHTGHGMLFLWEKSAHHTMWMKNTLIPLDMLFIDARGAVTQIVARTQPHSLRHIRAKHQALAVLEISGGQAQALNIQTGDYVLHPHFSHPPKCTRSSSAQ